MDPYSVPEYSDDEQETSIGKFSFDSVDLNQFKVFERVPYKRFVQFTGMSRRILKTLPTYKLKELQCSYYSEVLKMSSVQSSRSYEQGFAFSEANAMVVFKSRTRKADNSI